MAVVRLFQEDMFRQEHVYEDGFFLQECGGLVCDRHHACMLTSLALESLGMTNYVLVSAMLKTV